MAISFIGYFTLAFHIPWCSSGQISLLFDKNYIWRELQEEEEWGEDTSEEAIQKRMEDLTDAAKSLALDKDLEKTQQERVDLFYAFIKVWILPFTKLASANILSS